MKAVILAGGFGTRISEESQFKPKPMIEIGGMPILWHIMKLYSAYGINDFIICAGYRQHTVKEWFADYFLHTSDITFDFTQDDKIIVHNKRAEKWRVTVIDTGLKTMTGGRIKRIAPYLDDGPFFMTYGDGVSDINIDDLLMFHKCHGRLATIYINAGFMVLDKKVLDYIAGDKTMFEREPLEKLASDGELMCFRHDGFWQCMDTMRDKTRLEELWESGNAPWKVWED